MPQAIAGYDNPLDVLGAGYGWVGSYGLQFVASAELAVDTFFFMSGFLFAYLSLLRMQRPASNGRFPAGPAVAARYLRLTPSLGFAMLVYYKLMPFGLRGGPFFARFQNSVFRRCDLSWWSELTYTMNFWPPSSDDVCMGWTWYLGCDMVFYMVTALLLPVYFRRRCLGWAIMGGVTSASFGVTIWLVRRYGLSVFIFSASYTQYTFYAYSKPYCRIPAYFVGVALAWLLSERAARLGRPAQGLSAPLQSAPPRAEPLQPPPRQRAPAGGAPPIAPLGPWWRLAVAAAALGNFLIVIAPKGDFSSPDSWGFVPSVLYITFARPAWARDA